MISILKAAAVSEEHEGSGTARAGLYGSDGQGAGRALGADELTSGVGYRAGERTGSVSHDRDVE